MGQSKSDRLNDDAARMNEREAQLHKALIDAKAYIQQLEHKIELLQKITDDNSDDQN